jgi:hypothetical protein
MFIACAGSVIAVEQAARDFGLVVLTSDHDVQQGSQVLLDAAATNVEEGFELAATDNPTSTLLQVNCCCEGAFFFLKNPGYRLQASIYCRESASFRRGPRAFAVLTRERGMVLPMCCRCPSRRALLLSARTSATSASVAASALP